MKTMCKRTLAFLLCALLLCGTLPFTASASEVLSGECGKDGGNVTWTLDLNTGTLTISGTGEMKDFSGYDPYCAPWYNNRLLIQSVVIQHGVTSIGGYAFYQCTNLIDVAIPDSVTSIGEYAFVSCSSISNVAIPENVTKVGSNAFTECAILSDVRLPDRLTKLGAGAFHGCTSITNITIPASVTDIGAGTFNFCTSLTNVTIENGVQSIGQGAFNACASLKNITIPDSITAISNWVLDGTAYYNDESNWTEGVLYNGHHLIDTKKTISGKYIIPDGTLCIASHAFEKCENLTGVTIPDSVTNIGEYAFYNGSGLTSVTVPGSVENIYEGTFAGCRSIANVTIEDGVRSIGHNAFSGCTSLTSITIPDSVTQINNGAFQDSAYYEDDKNWTDSVLYIGHHLIKAKEGLDENYVILPGTTCIAAEAFNSHKELKSVTIPDSLKSIGIDAFRDCSYLTSVKIPDSVINIDSFAFAYCSVLADIELPSRVTHISDGVFYMTGLTSFTIPDNITSIGKSSFAFCTKLSSVTIPDSVTNIDNFAFDNCRNLASVTIPASVNSIGDRVFENCQRLEQIIVSESNSAYCNDENGVLYNKDKTVLKQYPIGNPRASFVIPNGVMEIGYFAFQGSTNLTSVTIPDSVKSIAASSFYGTNLKTVILPKHVAVIGEWAFAYCQNLVYAHIPSAITITYIGDNVFYECPVVAYICSDTADCYAKTYAEANGIPFYVCDGTHSEPVDMPVFHGDVGSVKAECPDGTFNEETYLRVSQGNSRDPLAEFGISIKGFATVQQLYYIHVQNEHGEYVQPNAGHKVSLRLPLILDGFGNPYPLEKYGVYHIDSETGNAESFRAKNHNLRIEGGYLVFEVSRFSPFIVTVEEDVPSIKMKDTKKTLPYGEKRTLTLDVESLPDGAKIVWTADNDRVELKPSADGRTCEVSAQKNGKVTITATVVGADGKPIEQDGEKVSAIVTLQTKANFFHKLWYWITRTPWPFG